MSCFYLTPKEDDFNYLDFLLAIGNLDDLPGEGTDDSDWWCGFRQ